MKINLDKVNDVTYKHVKFHYEILSIVSYTKIINSEKICRFEDTHTQTTCLSFLCSPGYNEFEHDFLQICRQFVFENADTQIDIYLNISFKT
jgi:hypothetical protein